MAKTKAPAAPAPRPTASVPPPPAPSAPQPVTTSSQKIDQAALPPVIVNVPTPAAPQPPPGPDVKTLVHQAPMPSVIQQAPTVVPSVGGGGSNPEKSEPIQQELSRTALDQATAPPPPPPTPPAARKDNPAIRTLQQRIVPEGGSAGYIDAAELGKLNADGLYPGQEVPYEKQQEIIRKQREQASAS